MKNKRKMSLLILVIGVALTAFGLYVRHRVNNVKGVAGAVSGWLPDNSVGQASKEMVGHKLSQYDNLIRWSLIGGVVLMATGVYLFVIHRKK